MFILDLCKALESSKIDYCLVGGVAVGLHGAIRGTLDIDIVVALNEKTFASAEAVLARLGLEPRLPLRAKELYQFREEYLKRRNLVAWGFIDPKQPQRQVDIILTHSPSELSPITLTVHGRKLKVASIEGLIRMKKKSGRPQDREDVKALQELLRR